MRQSILLLRTQKDAPKDEQAINAQLLIRGNFVEKLMAGVYSYLPLGFRVREKIMQIIREEMNALGSAEILMPALHPRSVWDATNRWESMKKIMYQFDDGSGKEIGLGPTHEEVVVLIARNIIHSYTDLPRSVYQIQTKYRNEPRAKSGLLRGREFTMKDLYSFHTNEASLEEFYELSKKAYQKVFARCGLKSYITEASGGDFSKTNSHEFMVESDAGEDEMLFCRLCGYAENKEIATLKKGEICTKCGDGVAELVHVIEVGNIFKLGTRFSEAVKCVYRDKEGATHPVVMGSYGIGIERLIGTIVELSNDEHGIIWPESVAPYTAHILVIGKTSLDLMKFAESVYTSLLKEGVDVLFDDREGISPGEKFSESDLIGIPWRIVVSEKNLVSGKIEVKRRGKDDIIMIKPEQLKQTIAKQ